MRGDQHRKTVLGEAANLFEHSRRLPRSRLAVGSSITTMRACCASARAISASWRSPPETRVTSRSARAGDPQALERLHGDLEIRLGRRPEIAEIGGAAHDHEIEHGIGEVAGIGLRDISDLASDRRPAKGAR